MGNVKKSIAERTRHKRQYDSRMNERQMQSKEGKVDSSKSLDVSLVVTECSAIELENSNSEHAFNKSVYESSRIESGKQVTSSSSGNYITHVVDAGIRPANDQVPFADVQLNAQHNVLVNEQQYTEQTEPMYDTYRLKKIDSNTTPDSTNMSHRGGEIDQDAEQYQVKSPLLNAEFFKTKDMVEKEVYNELLNRFLQLQKLCISLEISIQQKEETLKNELQKLKGNSMDTKFVKASILGKPPLQPSRNHSVVRQPKAFKSVRPRISKSRNQGFKEVKCDKQEQMASADNTSGPTPQRKERTRASTFDSWIHQIRTRANLVSPTPYVSPSKKDYEILFQPLFDEYFSPSPCAISPDPVVVTAPRAVDPVGSPLSTTIDQDVPSASTSPTNQEIQSQVIHQDPSSEETTLQGVIPSNLHHLNQSFDTLTKLTKNHPLENVIGDPSRLVLTRSQLQEHAIWCYFDANDNPIPFDGKRSG
ncbi:hypothetical protein Tco_1353701 [Tanacetum coccineum]